MDTSRLLTFIETGPFTKRWSEQDVELARLQSELIANPLAGEVIQGTGRFRKYRFADDNKGKSGSQRVIYYYFSGHSIVLLAMSYAKNVKATLSPTEKKLLARLAKEYQSFLEGAST
jgi:hypothetical protein